MLVIFTQDEYTIAIVANNIDAAWIRLMEHENKLLTEQNEDTAKKAKECKFCDVFVEREPYTIEQLKELWTIEGATSEGIVEFERGEVVYV